ncbi:MAG: hypothetical protein CMJ58_07535 [Planctomycetaceae bacterium]|nr:hypothetical protein [Planctomycetaceae bacterium]
MGRLLDILRTSKLGVAIHLTLWLGLCLYGLASLLAYSQTPGLSARPPHRTNVDVPRPADSSCYELVVAIHPHCPCTRATLEQLSRILRATQKQLRVTALFYCPGDVPDSFVETDLLSTAQSLPGTTIVIDLDGAQAARFQMYTSGATVLYAPSGEPVFFGGITVSRGHAGDCLGTDAVIAAVNRQERLATHTNVYGCPLRAPDACLEGAYCGQ